MITLVKKSSFVKITPLAGIEFIGIVPSEVGLSMAMMRLDQTR